MRFIGLLSGISSAVSLAWMAALTFIVLGPFRRGERWGVGDRRHVGGHLVRGGLRPFDRHGIPQQRPVQRGLASDVRGPAGRHISQVHFGVRLMSTARRIGIGVLVVIGFAWLALWGYSLRPAPSRSPARFRSRVGELGAICGFRDPEDLEYVASLDRVLVSEEGLGGRLLALRPSDLAAGPIVLWPPAPGSGRVPLEGTSTHGDCAPPDDPERYAPHGLSSLEPSTPGDPVRVAAVFHHLDEENVVRDAIQLFELVDGGDMLRWQGCIRYPEHAIGNDVAWLVESLRFVRVFAEALDHVALTGAGE